MSVLVGVFTCERDKEWLAACQDTWLKTLPTSMEFVSVDASFMPVNIKDSYDNLPHKTKMFAMYALIHGYSSVLKIDNDTYLRTRLLTVPTEEYAGRLSGISLPEEVPVNVENKVDYCSGGAYWLGKRAIEIIANAEVNHDTAEDRWVGNTLAKFGIVPKELPGYIAPYNISGKIITPVNDFLKNPDTIALMQMESPQHMREAYTKDTENEYTS